LNASLSASDPYQCGEGFSGVVVGGRAPYRISYLVRGPAGIENLGSITVADEGGYRTPPGFIDEALFTPGRYSVSIEVTSADRQTLKLDDLLDVSIGASCNPERTVVAEPPPSAVLGSATADATESPVLAFTGGSTATTSAIGLSLITLGSALYISIRRRKAL